MAEILAELEPVADPLDVDVPLTVQYPARFYLRLRPGKALPAGLVQKAQDGVADRKLASGDTILKRFKWTPEQMAAYTQAVADGVFQAADVMTVEQARALVASTGRAQA